MFARPNPLRLRGRLAASGVALAVAGALLLSAAPQAQAAFTPLPAPAGGHNIFVLSSQDAITTQQSPNAAVTVNVFRNGVQIATASGNADSTGLFQVNHPGGVCFAGSTPVLLPGDVAQVNGVEQTTVQNVTATAPTSPAAGTVVMTGTAADPLGAPLPVATLEARLVSKTLFSNGRRDIRAGSIAGATGILSYDAPGSINWTATWTGLSAGDVQLALGSAGRGIWLGAAPAALAEITQWDVGFVPGPAAALGCPALAAFGVSTAAQAGLPTTSINAAGVTVPLVLNGVSQDATAVSVTLTDSVGSVVTAPGVLSAPAGAQTWAATFPAAQLATLADGALNAAGTYTTAAGVLTGTTLRLTKKVALPPAPTATPGGGTFDAVQSVVLSDADPASTIHFTTNGTAPTAASPAFDPATGTIPVPVGSTTIQAVAVDAVGNVSPVASFGFAVSIPGAAPAPVSVTPTRNGYWLLASDGGVFAFGDAPFFGSLGGVRLSSPVVAMVATPSGNGYWMVTADGQVFSFGDAAFFGSMAGRRMAAPIVGMTSTPSGRGYWLLGKDGGIFSFGDAAFHGSTGAIRLNKPVLAMASTPSGQGYWLTASDGGIFAFGDAGFHGSTGAIRLNRPIVGMRPSPSGQGYWLTASDGGIFAFGDAAFHGSTGAMTLNRPIVGMAATPSGNGYLLIASDGGIFAFGDAAFRGSTGNITLNSPIISGAATR